ncbi:MAG: DUF302 domain-containing protein [Aliishimia sp.]
MTRLFAVLISFILTMPAAAEMAQRDGWAVYPTDKAYAQLVDDAKAAAKANGLGIVTQAGPTGAAKNRGITIPGNRVIGVFNNKLAVQVLGLSTAAMIEAPLRLYVTENTDGSATLAYKVPSVVFAPYADEGGAELADVASGLDQTFEKIATAAVK